MPTPKRLALAFALFVLTFLPVGNAGAGTDIELFSGGGGPAPNVLLLLDTSGSMSICVGEINCDKNIETCGSLAHNKKCAVSNAAGPKSNAAANAIINMLNAMNPPDGSGGRIENGRFGLGIYTGGKPGRDNNGGWVLVPVGSGTTDTIIDMLDSDADLDRMWIIGGNSHGLAQTDMARYLAYPNQFGTLPVWGAIDHDIEYTFTSVDVNAGLDTISAPGHFHRTKDPFTLSGASLPGGLSAQTYYLIKVDDDTLGLAATEDDAKNGVYVDITSAGDGTLTSQVGPVTEDPALLPPEVVYGSASFFDAACRDTFMILIADGLWLYDEKGTRYRYGECSTDTCWNETIGDADGDGNFWMDDISQVMASYDFAPSLTGTQSVSTYVVGFSIDPLDPQYQRLVDTATQGGGTYTLATDEATLEAALIAATQSIFDATASFSTAAVASSRTSFGSAFYNAFFEPKNDAPLWAGHLEAYRVSPDGVIQDAALDPAVDPVTNLLVEPHNPFWDAGIELQSNSSRTLYTTLSGSQVSFARSNSSITDTELDIVVADTSLYPNAAGSGIDTLAELRDAILDYVHGMDAFDEDLDTSYTDLRDVVLGDIFHSSPLVIGPPSQRRLEAEGGYTGFLSQYGTRDRVVYAGANDGMLHAFDAGTHFTGDDVSTPETESGYYSPGSGAERFGYVPGALLDRIKLIPRNNPRAYYFVDGTPVAADAWLGEASGIDATAKETVEWATVMITGFREGGPGYLALDVTDPDAVSGDDHGPYPQLLWEFTHSKLGDSWSEPVITRVKIRAGSGDGDRCGSNDGDGDCREQWVAIFAGGLEATGNPNSPSYIADPSDASWNDQSKALFVVALDSGQVLASVEFDATGTNGPTEMLYSIPSNPAVLDLNFDGFADVLYVGDLGGQLWKWDLSLVGEDTAGDSRIDNWPAGVFFRSDPEVMSDSSLRYRNLFFPPTASIIHGVLTLAFGSGERVDLSYPGVAGEDENNRFYVVEDLHPTGSLAFAVLTTEADLTDVTSVDTDSNPSDSGFFFVAADGEKFVTDVEVFADHVIVASYSPVAAASACATGGGEAFLYAFDVRTGFGFFQDGTMDATEGRRVSIGAGLPSNPRVTLGADPGDDKIYIKTSKGEVLTIDPPDRIDGGVSVIYWRQIF